MRVMHLLKHAQEGNGHVHVAVDLACAQADSGHDVVFASARGSYDDLLRQHGVLVHDLPEATAAVPAVRHEWALARLVRRVRPEVVHAHMMSSAVLALPVALAGRTPLVTTVHNSFDPHSSLMRLGTLVVAVSEAERQSLLRRGFPPGKVVTVLNGVVGSARDELPRVDIGDLRRPCVVTLCGLHARKGLPDAITAFARAAQDFPDWHLNIIGGGPDRQLLQDQVRAAGLTEVVHFVGYTTTPRYLLEQADVFVSSALAEPFSLSTAEARSAGCAVVATAVGGVPEVLGHGVAGQLVPASDPEAMAAALRGLMGNPEALAAWRRRAATGADAFSVRRMARDYEAVYARALRTPLRRLVA